MKTYLFLFMMSAFIVIGCKSATSGAAAYKPAKCITSDYKDFTLEWGYDYADSPQIMGYQLDENGYILLYKQDRDTRVKSFDSLGRIEGDKICNILEQLNSEMLKMPTLNEPGKKLCYIILKKPNVGMLNRVIWNEHNTYGSKGYRNLFDSLLSIVPHNFRN
ncbi:hypothetical protein SDC9_129088 [bioreactor metagenome]|uniref:Uncharacterized protein n=1 Tax=bioreactor metagenome TaxID=1076179 RepID=A0A645CXV2_9ZZZZ